MTNPFAGYVLEDVPHLADYIPHLPVYPNPLERNPSYSVVKQNYVGENDSVTEKIVIHEDSPRGTHFRRAGPREKVYFKCDDVLACIVICGDLCPGINTVIRELVCGLHCMYGVSSVLGIESGYRGFYAKNTISLTPKLVDDIHKRGGSFIGTSQGGNDILKIVDSIQDRGINQVYIIGGDGAQKGASSIFEEIRRRRLKISVVGIPKAIENDIPVIDKSFGFDTSVEEAQRAINAAHVEAESAENGIGVVKLMGRQSGFIALYATLASRDVDCCLIPELPFCLDGPNGLFEFMKKRIRENGHVVIVIAEGAGKDLVSENTNAMEQHDIGLWISQKIKDHFIKKLKMVINLIYIDPTYTIQAVPSIASDNVYCTLLAHSAIHGAMAGYTGFVVGPVHGKHAYIPFHVRRCFCGIIADRITSWTDTNPGRRYLQCVNQGKRGGCNLWDWYDPVMCRRSVQVIPGLLRMNAKDARIRELEMENARLKDMEELMTDLVEARMTDLVEANDKMKKLEAQIKALTEENAKMKVMEANLEGFLEDNDKLQKLKKMLAIIAVIWYIWSVNRK